MKLLSLKQQPHIVLLFIIQAWTNRAFENPDARQYHKNFHEAVPEPPKTFYFRPIQDDVYSALHRRLVESVKE